MAKVTQLTSTKWLREKYPDLDGDRLVDKMKDSEMILDLFADLIQVPELREVIVDKMSMAEIVDAELACLRHMKHSEGSQSPTD